MAINEAASHHTATATLRYTSVATTPGVFLVRKDAGHKTSISVEDEFWNSSKDIAGERGMTVASLVGAIDGDRETCQLVVSRSTVCAWLLSRSNRQLGPPLKMSKVDDPQHWRRRAEEARTLADELSDVEAKREMLKIAEEYEKLATRAERRLRDYSSATIRNW